jgi:hypothetical protein
VIRLADKLFTFGENFMGADTSIIAIAKDVALTSSLLTELANILANGQSGV